LIFVEENSVGGISYDRRLVPSDWRYSAAALGMIRFFKAKDLPFSYQKRDLFYRYEDIAPGENDALYLDFAEEYFDELFHHVVVKRNLKKDPSEETIKLINEKLAGNTVMKKHFKGIKYDGSNKDEILRVLNENRLEILRETFVNGRKLYKKFINPKRFRKEPGSVCRLLGYYVDTGRKLRSLGFGFDKAARTHSDETEFDFIPFAFSKGLESIFINSNIDISGIISSNTLFNSKLLNADEWRGIFYNYTKGSELLNYDVEIVKKGMETDEDKNEYYSSVHLREASLRIFQELHKRGDKELIDKSLKVYIKINENYYIYLMDRVTDCILNLCDLDELIQTLLKQEGYSFATDMMIRINEVIYRKLKRLEEDMEQKKLLNAAAATANGLVKKLKETGSANKIKSYRHKLTSALVANDYDRFIEIMLQLSSYTETSFGFLHELISDFKNNKNLAYAFVNALSENDYKSEASNKD